MKLPETDEEHRAFLILELRKFSDLVEIEKEARPLLLPLIRARHALNRFEDYLELESGILDGFRCLHCGQKYSEDYMVHNELWRAAVPDVAQRYAAKAAQGLPKRGLYLHLRCLEERIGRPLTIDDLTPAPINDAIRYFSRQKTD